jgi:hypothetical protein
MTQGGAESILECAGSESAMATAIGIACPGGAIGADPKYHEAASLGRKHQSSLSRTHTRRSA